MRKVFTLTIIHQPARVLLGMKKRGFGAGRWNGFGGKVRESESIEEAARREMSEEAGIEVGSIEKMGVIDFEFQGNPEILQVHIFCAQEYSGEPQGSEEMRPQWFKTDEIPFDTMWPDDKYWFPLFLSGKKFKGNFLFGPNDVVLNQQLEEVEHLMA